MHDGSRVSTTVLRRFAHSEVSEESPVTPVEPLEVCEALRDREEFIVAENGRMLEVFHTSAWNAIFPAIRALSFGGNPPSTGRRVSRWNAAPMDCGRSYSS